MFTTQAKPYRRHIADGLLLRSVETQEDAERLAEFNALVHSGDSGIRELTDRLKDGTVREVLHK